jgi:hypothetical protein
MSTVSKSYQYNGVCDVCGFKKKSYELRKRWDGFMVCEEDWEPRHVLDFYKTRNDTHQLPWTRPDGQVELTWTPTGNVTLGGTPTAILNSATYSRDSINSRLYFQIQYLLYPGSNWQFSNAGTLTLPVTAVSAGTYSARQDWGGGPFDLKSGILRPTFPAIAPGATTLANGTGLLNITNPTTSKNNLIITFNGVYGI